MGPGAATYYHHQRPLKPPLTAKANRDPEIQTLRGDVAVARFAIATSESYRDDKGKLHTKTDWHPVVAWRGLAELAQKYLRKVSHLYVEGKLKNRSSKTKKA
jgi:single-strand DNA-binding protein